MNFITSFNKKFIHYNFMDKQVQFLAVDSESPVCACQSLARGL